MTASRIAVVGTRANESNEALVGAWRGFGLDCELAAAHDTLSGGYDVAVGRLDVLPTLDGVEPGLLELLWFERRGGRVHNSALSLLRTHDKLRTAAALARAGLPHPRTVHLRPGAFAPLPDAPLVLKPRFGSWGRDVRLCTTAADFETAIGELSGRPWYRRHGVLVQEAIPSPGRDLRLLVAGGRIVGAIERHAAAGEWRTNLSVGGTKRSAHPSSAARALATSAAAAVGADFVGVDLLPLANGAYTIIELNGAVDFDDAYGNGSDVFEAVAGALGLTSASEEEAWPRPA